MRKIGLLGLCLLFLFLCYNTVKSAGDLLNNNWQMPQSAKTEEDTKYRLVLITQDIDAPFWNDVADAALEQARKEGVSIEIWGSYGNNEEEFLRKIDIALYSKVDGIIIQGLDTNEFKDLSKIKASSYGIPIITVANDVPMEESLRRTYVGSNQYEAGKMVADQLIDDMGKKGTVILMYDNHQEYYQEQRLSGIQEVLMRYPDIKIVNAETLDAREEVVATTQDMLNKFPDADAFIAVNAYIAGAMINEISKRSQIEPYYIYSFDDGPELLSLLKSGKMDGLIEQSPEQIGNTSVRLLVEWLNGETIPLDINGYFTDIHVLKAMDAE